MMHNCWFFKITVSAPKNNRLIIAVIVWIERTVVEMRARATNFTFRGKSNSTLSGSFRSRTLAARADWPRGIVSDTIAHTSAPEISVRHDYRDNRCFRVIRSVLRVRARRVQVYRFWRDGRVRGTISERPDRSSCILFDITYWSPNVVQVISSYLSTRAI